MKRISLFMMAVAASVVLTGCETIKSTISGPFIGLQKDMENFGNAVNSVTKPDPATGKSKMDNADSWMQKNLW